MEELIMLIDEIIFFVIGIGLDVVVYDIMMFVVFVGVERFEE